MVDLGSAADFPEGAVRIVQAGRHSVGVVRWRGHFYAVRNICPHQGGPACEGKFGPRLTADENHSLQTDDEVPVVSCAWHGWEFDARTGQSLWDERYKIKTWPLVVDSGRVLLDGIASAEQESTDLRE